MTNVFSKKILAKRALREIKLLQHFRGHRNVSARPAPGAPARLTTLQITCLYDMDIPRPDNFNETYLYEGECCRARPPPFAEQGLTGLQSSWSATWPPSSAPASL